MSIGAAAAVRELSRGGETMLAAQHRMRASGEFAVALRTGRRRRGRALAVSVATRAAPAADQAAPTRVGFVVGRQVGNAVVRNRVRRRLRHLMRTRLERLPAGRLVVLRALPPAAGMSSADLAAELDRLLADLLVGTGGRP